MKHIVVVEDDHGILDPLTIMLESAGYQVSGFVDGSGLLADDSIVPDLFVLDKQLPGIDGLELCRYLKGQQRTKHIPVIMLSATTGLKALAVAAMADDALEKPFGMRDFLDMIAKHIDRSE